MTKITYKDVKLPEEISNEWNIIGCLSIQKNQSTYLLKNKMQSDECILKVISASNFSKKKYRVLSHFSDIYLLLPYYHTCQKGTHYILYQKEIPLKEFLYENGLSLDQLYLLGIDLIYGVKELMKNHFFEADISPSNIYLKSNGHFCLGDINLQSEKTLGTAEWIAPELMENKRKSKKVSKYDFDKMMQYSICALLYSIFQLESSIEDKHLQTIISKGMQRQPENRFSSLSDFQNQLLARRTSLESTHCCHIIKISSRNHKLFQAKTTSVSTKKPIYVFFSLWLLLIITGCIFLIGFYRYLHPSSKYPSAESYLADTSSFQETGTSENTFSETTLPEPTSTDFSVSKPNSISEIDVQNYGLKTISTILQKTEDPDTIFCLYAGGNRLTNVKSIHRFPHLQELYLDNNQINNLADIISLEDLNILVLSYNQLTKITPLSHLKQLTYLDLSSNPEFTDVNTLSQLKQLTLLNIAGTKITPKQYQYLCQILPDCQIIY